MAGGKTNLQCAQPVLATFFCAFVACGPVPNENAPVLQVRANHPAASGEDTAVRGESEEMLGIVGGTNITSPSWLQAMRFIRQVTTVRTGDTLGTVASVNRYCSGVSMGGGVTLTASHCLNLTTNLEYDFFRFFYIAASHVCPTPPNPDGTPTCPVRPLGVVGAGLSILSAASSNKVSFGNNASPVGALPVSGLRTSFYNDVGFAYTAKTQSGGVVAPCTTLPVAGQTVQVTGLRLDSKTTTTTNLSWATYTAKVSKVMERLGEVSLFNSVNNSWEKFYTRSWSFESVATDPAACAERGDSGGAVFFQEVAGGPLCLMGINIAAGVPDNLGTVNQKCTPTTHRRITNQMLSSMQGSPLAQCALSATNPNCYDYKNPTSLSGPGAKINFSVIDKASKEFAK